MEKRNTKQKVAIRDAFVKEDRPLSPDEVLEKAKRHYGKLGIATVYRNIQSLVEEGWLQAVEIPGNPPRYEVAGKAHHHHFQCNRCNKLFELDGCIPLKLRLPRGFRATGHEFFLYGTCAECAPISSRTRA